MRQSTLFAETLSQPDPGEIAAPSSVRRTSRLAVETWTSSRFVSPTAAR